MRTARILTSLALCVAAAVTCFPAHGQRTTASGSANTEGLVYTRQREFVIPLRIKDVQNAADLPTEVRLHLSSDRGANWRLESRWRKDNQKNLRERQFTFRAPSDGEFWFKVQTIDRNGQETPHSGHPDLKVLVDTVQPGLTLNVRPAGKAVEADWQFDDPHLNASSFRIQYQVADGGPWQPVPRAAIKIPPTDPSRLDRRSGSARWNTAVARGNVSVMAMVSDACGNRAVVKQMVTLPGEHTPPPPVTGAAQPGQRPAQTATPGTPPGYTPQHQFVAQPGAGNPPAAAGGVVPYTPPRAPQPGGTLPLPRADGSARWPSSETAQRPLTSGANGSAPSGTPLPRPGNVVGGARNLVSPVADSAQQSTPPGRAGSTFGLLPPAVGPTAPPMAQPPASSPPASTSDHFVNSSSFALDYEIDTSDAPGVARVELWLTRDNGNSWQLFTTDNDRRSPVLATVNGDGQYGFQIVIDDVNGQGDPRPQPGDLPQMSVTVDRQAPLVQLIAAEPDLNKAAARLRIRWQAHDQQLAERPVSLHYSHRPDGEWFVIAAQLDNRGQFDWQLPPQLPSEVYIRVGVLDAAGNEGKAVSSTPIMLRRARPRGTLRGIRPSASTAAPPPAAQPRATQAYTPPIN